MNLVIDPIAAILDTYDLDELYQEASFRLRRGHWSNELLYAPRWVAELSPYFCEGRRGGVVRLQDILDTVMVYVAECAMARLAAKEKA